MKNVILITIDTLRADMLGAYGSTYGLTPFMDSLSDNMVVFSNSYATGPYTQSSFQGILASEYYLEYGKENAAVGRHFAFFCDLFGIDTNQRIFGKGRKSIERLIR